MNIFKGKINKVIFALKSAWIITLLIFPEILSAHHFRSGNMYWEPISDNGTHVTIRLKMQSGWSANHGHFRVSTDFTNASGSTWGAGVWVSGYIGSIKADYYEIDWGDNTAKTKMDHKIISRDNLTVTSDDCTSSGSNVCVLSTITELGEYASSTWTTGLTHTYPDNGTTEYTVFWTSRTRASVENDDEGNQWRNQTKVNIVGPYRGNRSPVSAVPPVVQVQDNKTFNYQLVATDADGDTLNYRWGRVNEFFSEDGSGSTDNFTMPTGMTLSSSGLVTWDVRDSVLSSNDEGDLWVAVIMIEDLADNGSVKSYIPIDFFFKTASASNDPPSILGIPTATQTVTVGDNTTFTFTSTDDSGIAPSVAVMNPPSDNISIWNTTTSNSAGVTTFSIDIKPISSMDNVTYAILIRSTDDKSMTKDQTLGLRVSSVSNSNPTTPTLVTPADNSTVTNPVTFQWEGAIDPENDPISYKIYICSDSGFAGCSGTSIAAGVNNFFNQPFDQYFRYNPFSWPSALQAATISKQISKYNSIIPGFVIIISAIGLLIAFIIFSVKNFKHRKILLMLFLILIGAVTCARSYDSDKKSNNTSSSFSYTSPDLATNTTYYWKVEASDSNGGSSESFPWSFTIQ